jgi:hypothetical protein
VNCAICTSIACCATGAAGDFHAGRFLAGLVVGLLFGRFPADWVEAVGTWFAGFVALFAVILAVVGFRSEEFARRLDQAQASRAERVMLQQEADLVVCKPRCLKWAMRLRTNSSSPLISKSLP